MKPKKFMLIAGEASGDQLAAELVTALRAQLPEATFVGAGGARMAGVGVELIRDMTTLSVVGITDVLARVFELRRLLRQLLAYAIEHQPDVVIGVDYGGFNLRLGRALQQHVRNNPFSTRRPRLVQFVSPQVWASRPGRAQQLARDYDLLLSIFPFEKAWYAERVPQLRVEFVGHPMVSRFSMGPERRLASDDLHFVRPQVDSPLTPSRAPRLVLLPGSRRSELQRHLPPMLGALELLKRQVPNLQTKMVLPSPALTEVAARWLPTSAALEIQVGDLPQALAQADLAIAKTGTVTMECAFLGVPAVTLYKGSWLNYQIARHFITVKTFTMPNLLADAEVYPEFLQYALTKENLAHAALELLQNEDRRQQIRVQLAAVVASLGQPGAPLRAAEAILSLLTPTG